MNYTFSQYIHVAYIKVKKHIRNIKGITRKNQISVVYIYMSKNKYEN